MKKTIMLMLMLMVLSSSVIAAAETEKETRTVTYGEDEQTVTVLWTDLEEESIRIESVLSGGKVGNVDEMMNIYNESQDIDGAPIAAINGSFFSAYTDFQPQGTLVSNGKVSHIANSGSVFTVDHENQFEARDLYIRVLGGINGQWDWPNNWYAWNLNHWYTSSDAVMVFDKTYNGPKPDHDFTTIAVNKKVVTAIGQGGFDIPEEGFLLLTNDQDMIDKFQIGVEADYRLKYYENDFGNNTYKEPELDFDQIRTTVGAGPTLIKDGNLVVDPIKEGFTEEKIYANPSTRSLIGVDANDRLGICVVQNVTVFELAEIAQSLGMVHALNLDGGASSGLILDGNYIFKPGRDLSNIVVIKKLYERPITIELNGKELFFDTEPYLNDEYDRTLVPLRGITEALGATVGWDGATSSITIDRYGTRLSLQVGSSKVRVNGVERLMDIPVTLRDSRSYVPVRFVTEFLGGEVGWIQETQTVTLTISEVDGLIENAQKAVENGNTQLAITEYLKVIDVNPSHLESLKALGDLYKELGDFNNSVLYHEKAIAIDADDTILLNSMGWYYYSNLRFEDSVRVFAMYADAQPESPSGYYGQAVNYAHYQVDDVDQAKKFYVLAIEKGLSGDSLTVALNYLDTH